MQSETKNKAAAHTRHRHHGGRRAQCARLAAAVSLLVLTGCANDFQAPVSEQGSPLVVTPPVIVDSSTADSSLRAPASRASAATGAAGTAAAARTVAATSNPNATAPSTPPTHRVARGDSLYSIAYQYNLDFRALAQANGLNPPYTIFVDQELRLNVNSLAAAASSPSSTLGVAVINNTVARARGTNHADGGVTRQVIGSQNINPNWQWPHNGPVARAFDAQSKGIDFAGRVGEPVYAAGDGDVVYSGRGIQGAGELIILRHSDRYLSAYSHNSAMLVKEGDRVRSGQQIAEVGQNPAGTPTLHFEIRVDGQSVDPAGLLPRR